MASIAQSAVLVSSSAGDDTVAHLPQVAGPAGSFHDAAGVLSYYRVLGFQASHYAQACEIARRMLVRQSPSRAFSVVDGAFVEVADDGADAKEAVYPTIFLGITANLFGTGCREAVRFLIREGVVPWDLPNDHNTTTLRAESEWGRLSRVWGAGGGGVAATDPSRRQPYRSFVGALVVSGGAMEHDLRRALEAYEVGSYASEEGSRTGRRGRSGAGSRCHFGNVSYPSDPQHPTIFRCVMTKLVERLGRRQAQLRTETLAGPVPEAYSDVCTWTLTPSELWALAGLWLVDLITEALLEVGESTSAEAARETALTLAQDTVVYWAAQQKVPVFSPSFVDGDIMELVMAAAAGPLQIDLVRDIHSINKLAMLSKRTGMIVCGGGVVKHHVCNANLMRNGADYTIVMNNGQEFDGSDGGARPDEAVSWGKIRIDGESVKVYGEVTCTFPLLVTQVFVAAVRQHNIQLERESEVCRQKDSRGDE